MATNNPIVTTQAFIIKSDLQVEQKEVTINYIEFPTTAFTIICLILTFITTVLLFAILIRLIKRKAYLCKPMKYFTSSFATTHTNILLEITSYKQSVVLHLTRIPVHYSQCIINNASITLYNIMNNCCNTHLRVNWNATNIEVTNKFSNIPLPEFIPIPFTCINLTSKILNNPNININLLLGTNGVYIYHQVIKQNITQIKSLSSVPIEQNTEFS
jgi:hypothetical protein